MRTLTLATKRISHRMIETKYQEVASDEGLDKRDINVYRSLVKMTGYNSHGHNSQVKCLKTDTTVFLFSLRRNKVLFLKIRPKKKRPFVLCSRN